MISAVPNLAINALVARMNPELILAQVLIRRLADGFELRHVADRDADFLRVLQVEELRELAQLTDEKQFRPLKSAPTLRRGWRTRVADVAGLEVALSHLYPGAVADWFAAQEAEPPVTHYREFTARQTGMYRITTILTDDQVGEVARAGCHARFCLKRRLWGARGLPADAIQEKSLIPCLEPCAVLMEFARTAVRLAQREKVAVPLCAEEWETVVGTLQGMTHGVGYAGREADFTAPENPRRIQLLLEKVLPVLVTKGKVSE